MPDTSLCSLVLNKNAETEFWVKQKGAVLTALPGKAGPRGLGPPAGALP